MTYGDLNRRSNQFAQYLRTLGVKADSLVALCLGRSVAQIWSALAVLKAGGAYVPLDPSYPVDRISFHGEGCGAMCAHYEPRDG